jgi:hypothetical protein
MELTMTVPFELQIIHRYSGMQLFSYRFREDIKLDPTLISGFISAVISFTEELKPSEGKEIIKFIDRGDFVLQVEPGKNVIGVLIMSSKDYSFRDKLRMLVLEFERRYGDCLENWNGMASQFDDFEEQVKQLISTKPLSPYHIPKLINTDRAPKKLDDIKWAIITRINGENDIHTISEELDLTVEVVKGIISYFEEAGLVQTVFRISGNTVIELTKKGLRALEISSESYQELNSVIGEKGLKIISLIGTERRVQEITRELEMKEEEITSLLEQLVSEKYIDIQPTWKVVLDKQAFQFTRTVEFFDDLIQLIFDESDKWLNFRSLDEILKDTITFTILRDETVAHILTEHSDYVIDQNNLKNLFNQEKDLKTTIQRLNILFSTLQRNIERKIGSNLMKDILSKVNQRLKEEYPQLLSQQQELHHVLNWLE